MRGLTSSRSASNCPGQSRRGRRARWRVRRAGRPARRRPLAQILEGYERVAARSEEIIATVPDLSATHPLPEAPWNEPGAEHSVRRVLMHVIAETAQHAGHADILRETLDGQKSS
ncbi:DUF664 domain-containing protein [Streptomyces milbemycinicus]|uniref:mycothiol transferase n=1 Tax=Streptomyces milbemycinicus TaxID=476552 RepID=UPI0033D65B48